VFTERMDYFCAFSVVSYSLAAFFLRLLGTDWNWRAISAAFACASVFVRHVYHMGFVKFDYGYNMLVCVSVGLVNSVCWLAWCAWHWKTRRKAAPWAALSVLAALFTTVLELLDFPPIMWTFDSHALWHASTAPIHFSWYTFAIQDCLQSDRERKMMEEDKKDK